MTALGRTPEERFYSRITEIERQLAQTKPLQIPILDEDPGPEYAGNIWALNDGRLHVRFPSGTVLQYNAVASTGVTSSTPLPSPPAQPTTQALEWPAVWSASYAVSGAAALSIPADRVTHGVLSESDGNTSSMIGFDYADIVSMLSGSTITRVELFLQTISTGLDAATCTLAGHNNATAPVTLGADVTGQLSTIRVMSGGSYHSMSTQLGAALRAGTMKGFILSAASASPSSTATHVGFGSGDVPRLRVTFTK